MDQHQPYRITIRNVDPEIADLLRNIANEIGVPLGEAFDEAVLALDRHLDSEECE